MYNKNDNKIEGKRRRWPIDGKSTETMTQCGFETKKGALLLLQKT